MFQEKYDKFALIGILVILGLSLFLVGFNRDLRWDEAAHANSALFTYNLIIDSPDNIECYAVDYHSHYKFFTVFASYPPLHMLLSTILFLVSGPWFFLTKIVVLVETILLVYFIFKLAGLFDRERIFPFIAVLLFAVHPIFLDVASRNYLEAGVALFTVMSVYFFIRFMRTESVRDLYLTALALGLGLLIKPMIPVIILSMMIVFLLERRFYLVKEYKKELLKSFLILLIVSIPLILQVGFLHSQGLYGVFSGKWSNPFNDIMPSFEAGPPVWAWDLYSNQYYVSLLAEQGYITDFQELTKNASAFLFQWYLIPFFLMGIFYSLKRFRKGFSEIEKFSILIPLIVLYIFTVLIHGSSMKHLLIALPFIILLSAKGLVEFFRFKRVRNYRFLIYPILVVFVAASIIQAQAFLMSANESPFPQDFDQAARFVLREVSEPVTVLTTYGQQQMMAFTLLDMERDAYLMYMPKKQDNIMQAVNGDFSYYQSFELWEGLGISHPEPGYIILYESSFTKSRDYDYGLDYFDSRPESFELATVIEGANDRVFIYRILD